MNTAMPQPSASPTWEATRAALRAALSPVDFETWFAVATAHVEQGEDGRWTLALASPTKLHTTRIREDFLEVLTQVWSHVAPDGKLVLTEQSKPEAEQQWQRQFESQTGPASQGTGGAAASGQVLLPAWADSRRATASAVFRSALFPALARGHRKFVKNQKIFSTRGVDVFFTGEQFDQSDLDVYLEILHLLKDQPLGTECTFTAYELLKALGRDTGYSQHLWLYSVLIRLTACAVDITDHQAHYFGPLLEGGTKDKLTKAYTIRVNPEFAALFKRSWSSLDRAQRRMLRGNPTAQSLHSYYSGHVVPGPHEFATLAGIAGVNNSNKGQEKARIIKAHKEMKEMGFLKGYEVTGDTIQAQINHTPSQNRHLARTIMKERKRRGK